jgi:hypothetical protein
MGRRQRVLRDSYQSYDQSPSPFGHIQDRDFHVRSVNHSSFVVCLRFDATKVSLDVTDGATSVGAERFESNMCLAESTQETLTLNGGCSVNYDVSAPTAGVAVDVSLEECRNPEAYLSEERSSMIWSGDLVTDNKVLFRLVVPGAPAAGSVECPVCEAPERTTGTQRVRKEMRSLSTAEWHKVVNAMWAMKNTTQADGARAIDFSNSLWELRYLFIGFLLFSTLSDHAVAVAYGPGSQRTVRMLLS